MIITRGFNPRQDIYVCIYKSHVRKRKIAKKSRAGKRGRKVKDGDIDSILELLPFLSRSYAFLSLSLSHTHSLFDPPSASAMGGTRWPLVGHFSGAWPGLCVVINGNLKQRELTISFFISSPMLLGAQEASRSTPTHARSLQT